MERKLRDLRERKERIRRGGGEERVQRQHRAGKLTARERLTMLLDPGTFVETGAFVAPRPPPAAGESPADGVITGYGGIRGRLAYVYAQDFTVLGGTLGEMHADKICRTIDLALKAGAPLVSLVDSGGARIQEGVAALHGYGRIFLRNTLASGVIPQISVIMGPCAGGASYSPGLTDFIFMVDQTSQMFITGPQVIKAVTGEEVSAEDLGGAAAHNRLSGVAHFLGTDEQACLEAVKDLLDYLPANNLEDPPRVPPAPPPDSEPALADLVPEDPARPYDVRQVIAAIVDGGRLMEVQASFAPNIVVGFCRFHGYTVGVVANQPAVLAGCLDINASDKASRFVRFCDAFNIPLLTLVDTPGYLPGIAQEHGGIIRHGAKLLYAYSEATVPKVTVLLRKAYGGAYLAMCARALGADYVLAWPSAEIAVMGPEGAVNVIYREELARAPDPDTVRRQRIEEYRERFAHPYAAAALGLVDDVIEPRETRAAVISALGAISGKRESRPPKKHGIIPV